MFCVISHSRLESSRMANVFPAWWGSFYKVIVLSGDGCCRFHVRERYEIHILVFRSECFATA